MEAGMQVLGASEAVMPGIQPSENPKLKVKAKAKPKAAEDDTDTDMDVLPSRNEAIVGACVGLPVQFCLREGELTPGVLQRQSKSSPSLWDVKIDLGASNVSSMRHGAPYSKTPKPGHWNFLPVPGYGG